MSYATGTAATLADLLTAIRTAATGAGWTLSTDVLHNGACFARLYASAPDLYLQCGTGIDGSDALTGAAPAEVLFGSPLTGVPWSYPLAYFIHAYADEVWVVVNWSTSYYTIMGFGASPAPGLPGSGCWFTGSLAGDAETGFTWWGADVYWQGHADVSNYVNATGPFWTPAYASAGNSFVHHGLDGGSWSDISDGATLSGPSLRACGTAGPKLVCQPNAWNSEIVLVPIEPYIDRGENHTSIVLDIKRARYVNLQTLDPQAVIDLTPDKWKVYPFAKKGGTLAPDVLDSGWLGIAIAYDGP